jgi:hypothetical protein
VRRAAAVLACALLGGCYASSPLAPAERTVVPTADVVTWRPATPDDLPGLWASTHIEGGSAGAVLKAYYAFDADGGYTAAALVLDEGRPRLVLLAADGRWTLDGPALDLHDGGPPFAVSVAVDRLRLVQGEDALELARVPLD